jgi:hypothetical protein
MLGSRIAQLRQDATAMSPLLPRLRSVRLPFLDIAAFDAGAAVLGVGWLAQRTGVGSFWQGAALAIPLGVVVHHAFGIRTPLNTRIAALFTGTPSPPIAAR